MGTGKSRAVNSLLNKGKYMGQEVGNRLLT